MLQCIVVTPEQTLYDQQADFVALTLCDGEIGIAPSRAAMIGRLGAGEMRIRRGDATTRCFVDGGFVEVLDDVVSVLTHRAVPTDEIDTGVVEQRLSAAQARSAATPESLAARRKAIESYRAELRVARRADR